jgi:shikimate dehydrogenase
VSSRSAPPRPGAAQAPAGLVILGHPVVQSLSPVFQQAALNACGLSLRYEQRDVAPAALHATLRELHAGRIGGNATLPHKEAMFTLADRHTPMAERAGAVNTFWWEGDALVGHNTDVDGVTATLQALCRAPLEGAIVVLGAGGAAAAVLIALSGHETTAGRPIHLVARTAARAHALLERVGVAARVHPTGHVPRTVWQEAGLVVNTTPIGMQGPDMPVDPAQLRSGAAVFDLVYRIDGSPWVHLARSLGLRAEDGLRMLVEQGASAFTSWFGLPAPRVRMWGALGQEVPPVDDLRPLGPQRAAPEIRQ